MLFKLVARSRQDGFGRNAPEGDSIVELSTVLSGNTTSKEKGWSECSELKDIAPVL
jgi:hypothetical protein